MTTFNKILVKKLHISIKFVDLYTVHSLRFYTLLKSRWYNCSTYIGLESDGLRLTNTPDTWRRSEVQQSKRCDYINQGKVSWQIRSMYNSDNSLSQKLWQKLILIWFKDKERKNNKRSNLRTVACKVRFHFNSWIVYAVNDRIVYARIGTFACSLVRQCLELVSWELRSISQLKSLVISSNNRKRKYGKKESEMKVDGRKETEIEKENKYEKGNCEWEI